MFYTLLLLLACTTAAAGLTCYECTDWTNLQSDSKIIKRAIEDFLRNRHHPECDKRLGSQVIPPMKTTQCPAPATGQTSVCTSGDVKTTSKVDIVFAKVPVDATVQLELIFRTCINAPSSEVTSDRMGRCQDAAPFTSLVQNLLKDFVQNITAISEVKKLTLTFNGALCLCGSDRCNLDLPETSLAANFEPFKNLLLIAFLISVVQIYFK